MEPGTRGAAGVLLHQQPRRGSSKGAAGVDRRSQEVVRNERRPNIKARVASKPARPFLGPALDHHFFVRIKFDGVAPLAVYGSEEAVAPAAEREVGHGSGN